MSAFPVAYCGVGRVCMDQTMLKVDGISRVDIDHEVVIMGQQGRLEISVEHQAKSLGTIVNKVVTSVRPGSSGFISKITQHKK